MLKKLSKYLCFSLLLLFIACAPKPKIAPVPAYEEKALTLDEIIAKASKDITVLKAITAINIEKNNEPYSFINASVLIKNPGWVHMRMYQLGILVRDFVIRDDRLYVLSGSNDSKLKKLGDELYSAIFWWEGYDKGEMTYTGDTYIIKASDREIEVDGSTLLPLKQDIRLLNKNILISYSDPAGSDDFWYHSQLSIFAGEFKFTVKIKKLMKNPSLGEFDFQVPSIS